MSPTAAELLDTWDRGRDATPVERALLACAVARPGTPPGDLARLPIGRRDALLMDLREAVFGPTVTALSDCVGCGERIELGFTQSDIRVETGGEPPGEFTLPTPDGDVRFRLPNSLDVAAVAGCTTPAAARAALVGRCVQGPRSESVIESVAARMAEADPLADVRLALSCPSCGRNWTTAFDVAGYFWAELDAWARRTLREVHALATAYGWTEADVLALPARRRQAYLDLVGG